jgi:hypothetical protein
MALSPLQAAQEALDLTGRRLFPFHFQRWLALGFVAFLDGCGRKGGFGSSYQFPGGGSSGSPGGVGGDGGVDVSGAREWIAAHIAIIGAIAVLALVVIVAVTAVILWLNSRGVFMYADNVATGRYDVVRPWNEHRDAAWSYFFWSFGLALVGLLGVVALLVPIGFLVFSMLTGGGVQAGPILGIIGLVLLIMVFAVAMSVVSLLLRDFAAPLQMKLGIPCGEALRIAWGIAKGSPGGFLGYVGLKILFTIVAAIVAFVAGCFTCCIGFLPVVAQTLLQPFFYFERAWSLFLLRQAGHDLFPAPAMTTNALAAM